MSKTRQDNAPERRTEPYAVVVEKRTALLADMPIGRHSPSAGGVETDAERPDNYHGGGK